MHPILLNRRSLFFYLLVWITIAEIAIVMLSLAGHFSNGESIALTFPLTFGMALICLSPIYMCRSMPFDRTSVWRLFGSHLLAAVAASGLVLALVNLMASALGRSMPGLAPRAVSVLLYLLSVGLHYAGLAVESSRRAEVLARDAELKALKAQINPHFLFNSLNSISALTSIDPTRAREMCIHLSDFLRTSLRLGESVTIPFATDLELARTYLNVEKVRFGNRLRVKEEIDPACAECDIPPLLLQPLVENSIKHGIANLVDGGEIHMSAHRNGKAMQFIIDNPFDPECKNQATSGIGLKNVRDRLANRFGSSGNIEVSVDQDQFRVTLTLPCEHGRTV
jgi:two-component system sensor histidine kinase AlgZ